MKVDESFFKGESREGFYIEEKMKRAWAAQIEVLEEIRRICTIHNIPFFADWGTLLGAVRHKGFVPWDDDLDVGMLRPDYEKFLKIAEKELNPEFMVKSLYNDPTHDNVKARVFTGHHMNFDKEYLTRFHQCPYVVGIDIFPLDYIPRNKKKADEQKQWINYAMTASASVSPEPPYSKDEYDLCKKLENLTGFRINRKNNLFHEFKKLVDEISAMYTEKESDDVCSMIDFAMGWPREYRIKKECYQEASETPFEYTTVPVPVGYNDILTIKYSENYMTPVQGASSHDYPFYKQQEEGLAEVLENEFNVKLTKEMTDMLIAEKIAMSMNE